MAKAVGLDTSGSEVVAVELDGSYKKPRMAKLSLEPRPTGGSPQAVAEAALRALKEGSIGRDGTRFGFPCREAVLRTIDVPFVGRDAIRKVIKFEAEGSIHSHNVDDMVVDFHELSVSPGSTKVMVAAVPKAPLRETLEALDKVGVEAELVDLDAMALHRVAAWYGAYGELAAEEFEDAEAAEEAGAIQLANAAAGDVDANTPARLVVDVGERSIRILVVQGGRLIDVRALRFGSDAVSEEVARSGGIGIDSARVGVEQCLASGGDWAFEETEFAVLDESDGSLDLDEVSPDAPAEEGDDGPGPSTALASKVEFSAVEAARNHFLARLRRELVRFATSVPTLAEIEALWITGIGSRMVGVDDVLADVFDARPRELDVLTKLRHSLDDEFAAEIGPRLAVPVGLALGGLGGTAGFNFRQEDLAYARQFDRLKFPLAIAAMLALFLSVLFVAKAVTQLRHLGREYGETYATKTSAAGRRKEGRTTATFFGHVGSLLNQAQWFGGGRFYDRKEYDKLVNDVLKTDTFKRLPKIRSSISAKLKKMQTQIGQFTEFRLSSGLGVLNEMAVVLGQMESRLGRFLVTEIDLKLPPTDRSRKLTFDVALRKTPESDFRTKIEALEQAFKDRIETVPDTGFLSVSAKPGKQFNSEDGPGSYFEVTLLLKPEKQFPVYPLGSN